MRRKKKLIINILKIFVVLAISIGLFLLFKPKKKLNTADTHENGKNAIKVTTINESNIHIDLPTQIKDYKTKEIITNDKKTYTPITQNSERYLIPILSNNEVTILIGDDSNNLLNDDSPVHVGNEYKVSGISETIQTVFYFTVENYNYPIFLLLGKSGKLYYVDIQQSYSSGNFSINGYIENIPEVQNVYQVTVTENKESYRSAVIECNKEEGYEFNIDMIGK